MSVARADSRSVWDAVAKCQFGVIGWTTAQGEPRTSMITYACDRDRLFLAVSPASWKARQIAERAVVSVTVPVRRAGLLSLVFPIPPSSVSFRTFASIHPPGTCRPEPLVRLYRHLHLPANVLTESTVIELVPFGSFQVFGVGVALWRLGDLGATERRTPIDVSNEPCAGQARTNANSKCRQLVGGSRI